MPKTAEDILNTNRQEFRALVEEFVRNPDGELANLLRSPPVVERLYETLLSMYRSVKGQLAAREAELLAQKLERSPDYREARERYYKWRAGSIRFKVALEEALCDVRLVRRNSRLATLEEAIREHRDAFPDDDGPSDDDKRLWATLTDSP